MCLCACRRAGFLLDPKGNKAEGRERYWSKGTGILNKNGKKTMEAKFYNRRREERSKGRERNTEKELRCIM